MNCVRSTPAITETYQFMILFAPLYWTGTVMFTHVPPARAEAEALARAQAQAQAEADAEAQAEAQAGALAVAQAPSSPYVGGILTPPLQRRRKNAENRR